MNGADRQARQRRWKRGFDLLVAVPGLALVSPVLGLAALVLRLAHGSPILYRQARAGLHCRTFELLKFRTMTGARDGTGNILPDEARLTSIGRFLRASSIDELPSLFNVIRGDLSLVGPRPLMAKYLPRYSAEQLRRHDVVPGITGWAQVNGRNALSWSEKFVLDVWYVDHWSFGLDIKIMLLTLVQVLRRHGIAQAGHATMPEFSGNSSDANAKGASR